MSWQKILNAGFASAKELLQFLHLPANLGDHQAEIVFKSRVPLSFAQKMRPQDPKDPLLLQVLASPLELLPQAGFSKDPLEENANNPLPGLLHKYYGRVLLTLTSACAIHCRYCFRRNFPYEKNNPGRQGWQKVIAYIQQDTSIHEVIFSGGDPLLVSGNVLKEIIEQLENIAHVTTIRFHTRIPIVLPERINASLLSILQKTTLNKVIVIHSNHPQEIDDSISACFKKLTHVQCLLLNQSVLLKNINDDAAILAQLSHRLFDSGVLPYYLHVLDKAKGTAHFDLPFSRAQRIFKELQGLLPGYLLPRLTREIPGKTSKTLLI